MLSLVQLFSTPCTVAHQAPLSMGFSGQEYWSGLPFPSPVELPAAGVESTSPALAENFFTTRSSWETIFLCIDAGELIASLCFPVWSCLSLYISKCISLYRRTFCSYSSFVLKLEYHVYFLKNSTPKTITTSLINSAAAKSLQSCLTLCDPIDGSPPGSHIPGIL